jgi:hypothetical protein
VLPSSEKLETYQNYLRHGKTGQIKNMTCHKNPSPDHDYYKTQFSESFKSEIKNIIPVNTCTFTYNYLLTMADKSDASSTL